MMDFWSVSNERSTLNVCEKYLQGRSGKGLVHEPKIALQSSDDPGIAFSSDFVGECNFCGACFAVGGVGG